MHNVTLEMDLLSEDTDYAEYWIMEAVLLAKYRPKNVIVEVNQQPTNVTTKKSIFVSGMKPRSERVRFSIVWPNDSTIRRYIVSKKMTFWKMFYKSKVCTEIKRHALC